MASLKKTKTIDPPCRLGFSTTESVRRKLEAARVQYEDLHKVTYSLGEITVMVLLGWLDQDPVTKATLTDDQMARIEKAMGNQAEA